MPNTLDKRRRAPQRRRGRGPARFKKTDVVRAAKATLAAGLSVARVEIDPNGKIAVLVGQPGETAGNDLDHWMAKRANNAGPA